MVTAEPDMANAHLGVQTSAERADSAVAGNSELTTAVIAAIAGQEVAFEDIQTSTFSLYAQRDYDNREQPEVVGYWANNSVRVIIRDLDGAGRVLQAAIDAGANTVNGLSFTVSNADALRQQARTLAVADARSKAETLAEAAGARLGDVKSIREQSGSIPVFARAEFEADSGVAVPIEPGELSVTAQVEVVFELR